MKILSLSVAFLFCFTSILSAQDDEKINWMTMDEALEAQKKEPKKIFMDTYTNWCPPCKMLDKQTYSNDDVADYVNEHFYPVKFNAEGDEEIHYQGEDYENPNYDPDRKNKRNAQHSFAHSLHVMAYPTMLFFDEDSDVIKPVQVKGFVPPEQLEIYLKMVAQDDYEDINSQGDMKKYQEDFEGTFSNN